MIDPLGNEEMFSFMKTAMTAAVKRHEMAAANIANIDTPGYKAKDMNFEAIMQEFTNQEEMRPSRSLNLNGRMGTIQPLNFQDYIIEDDTKGIVDRVDGNNVNLDAELGKMSHAAGRYEIATLYIQKRQRLLADLVRA